MRNSVNNWFLTLRTVWALLVPETQESKHIPSVLFSSVHDGIYALAKAHKRSIPSFGRILISAFETVSVFVYAKIPLCRPFKEVVKHFLFLHPSPPDDRWGGVLGFVPAACLCSSSATSTKKHVTEGFRVDKRGREHFFFFLTRLYPDQLGRSVRAQELCESRGGRPVPWT